MARTRCNLFTQSAASRYREWILYTRLRSGRTMGERNIRMSGTDACCGEYLTILPNIGYYRNISPLGILQHAKSAHLRYVLRWHTYFGAQIHGFPGKGWERSSLSHMGCLANQVSIRLSICCILAGQHTSITPIRRPGEPATFPNSAMVLMMIL
jgi:hypothetical protein